MNSELTKQAAANRKNMWGCLRVFVGAILFIAASIKCTNVSRILATGGLLNSHSVLMVVIGAEGTLAWFIWFGPGNRSWQATLLIFSTLASIAAYATFTQQDCNCFGETFTSTSMLGLDVGVLALAIWARPRHDSKVKEPLTKRSAFSFIVGLLLVGFAEFHYQNQIADVAPSRSIEMLLAENLAGKSWPIGDQLHPRLGELTIGNWLVVVVRSDCQHCIDLIGQFFPATTNHRDDERTAVFIAGSDNWPFAFDSVSMQPVSTMVLEWPIGEPFVASPAVFQISNGLVIEASDGKDSEAFLKKLFSD